MDIVKEGMNKDFVPSEIHYRSWEHLTKLLDNVPSVDIFRPPSRMAVSRSYPSHFFNFCEKEKKHSASIFSSFASFFYLKRCIFFNLYNLTEHGFAWLNSAQLNSRSPWFQMNEI